MQNGWRFNQFVHERLAYLPNNSPSVTLSMGSESPILTGVSSDAHDKHPLIPTGFATFPGRTHG